MGLTRSNALPAKRAAKKKKTVTSDMTAIAVGCRCRACRGARTMTIEVSVVRISSHRRRDPSSAAHRLMTV